MTRYEAARSALLASVSLMDSARRLQEAANAMLETVAYDLANEAKFEKQLAEFRWLARTSNDAMAFVNDAEMSLFTSNAIESFEKATAADLVLKVNYQPSSNAPYPLDLEES